MKKNLKLIITFLLLIAIVLNIKMIKNEYGTYTILETIKYTYQDYTITLNENPYFESISAAVNAANNGETIYVVGDLEIRENFEIPAGITVEIQSGSNVSLAAGYTVTNEGTIKTNSATSFNVSGNIILAYDSTTEISGILNFFGETATMTTTSKENYTNEYATMVLKDGSSFIGDDKLSNVFNGLNKINIENYGANITDRSVIALFHDGNMITSHGVHIIGTDTYYDDFSSIPMNANIEITTFLYLDGPVVIGPTVTVNVKENKPIVINGALSVLGTLKMNDNLLIADTIAGVGNLYITPGKNALEPNTVVKEDIPNTLTIHLQRTPSMLESIINIDRTLKAGYDLETTIDTFISNLNIQDVGSGRVIKKHSYTPSDALDPECWDNTNVMLGELGTRCKIDQKYYVTAMVDGFPDPYLYSCILDANYALKNSGALRPTNNTEITVDDFKDITKLSCPGKLSSTSRNYYNIESVDGLTILENLEELDLNHNEDLHVVTLPKLKLKKVNLNRVGVYNLSIANDTIIEEMDLSDSLMQTFVTPTNNTLTKLDLSNNSWLTEVDLSNLNALEEIFISNNPKLTTLTFDNPNVTALDITGTILNSFVGGTSGKTYNLDFLLINSPNLTNIDISNLKNLTYAHIYTESDYTANIGTHTKMQDFLLIKETEDISNKDTITSLDFSAATNLKMLSIKNTDLSEFKINLNNMQKLNLTNNNLSGDIVFNNCNKLLSVILNNNSIESFDAKSCGSLSSIELTNNNIKSLDISDNLSLLLLRAENNGLETLITGENTSLISLFVGGNKLTTLNTDKLTSLTYVGIENNPLLPKLDFSKNNSLSKVLFDQNNYVINTYLSKEYVSTTHDITFDELNTLFNLPSFYSELLMTGNEENTKVVINKGKTTKVVTYEQNTSSPGQIESFKVSYNYFVPEVTSSKYDVDENINVIYINEDSINNVLDNITITNGVGVINETNLEVKETLESTTVLDTYKIAGVTTTIADVDKNIHITEKTTVKEIKSKFNIIGDVILKAFYGNGEEVISENDVIKVGMQLKVIVENKVYETYIFNVVEYIDLDGVVIDEEEHLIKNLTTNLTTLSFEDIIDTNGTITYYNHDEEELTVTDTTKVFTGMKVKIELPSKTYEYTLSVKGDVTGTGSSSISDVMRIVEHVIGGEQLQEKCYKYAADTNDDSNISISDVMKLVGDILG